MQRVILRALPQVPSRLPEDGTHDVPKHEGDLLTYIDFGACNIGFTN